MEEKKRFSLLSFLPRYTTPRQSIYVHTGLSVIYSILLFGVIVYTVCTVLLLHKYAYFEIPNVVVNFWDNPFTPTLPDPPPMYCNNDTYNFLPESIVTSGGYICPKIGCQTTYEPFILSFLDSEVIVATMLINGILNSTCGQPNSLNVTQALQAYERGCTWAYFIPSVEELAFNMQHSYSTSWLQYQANVRTVVYDSKGNAVRKTDDGVPLTNIKVGDILDWAGITLDQRNRNSFIGISAENSPFYRLTGVIILMRMRYSNLRSWDIFDRKGLCEITFGAQEGIWGASGSYIYYDTNLQSNVQVAKTALRLKLITEGNIGVFELYSFVVSVVSSLALITATDFFMIYVVVNLHKSSVKEMFWKTKRARVHLDRQYNLLGEKDSGEEEEEEEEDGRRELISPVD